MPFTLQIIAVFALIGCGFYARKRGMITAQGTTDLARLATDLLYPALIFTSVIRLSAHDLAANALLPVLVMVIALVGLGLGLIAVRFLGAIPVATHRAFLFHCLINNYLFLPLPLVYFLYGDRGVALLVFSSVGYELIVWTLGIFLISGNAEGWRKHIRNVLSPSFVTLMLSLIWVMIRDGTGIVFPPFLDELTATAVSVIRFLAEATVAATVIVAGSRFAVLMVKTMLSWRIWLLSAIRLVLVPLALVPVFNVVALEDTARSILFIVAVMPSAMLSVLFAERYGGDSEFIAGGLLVTHLWAVVTVPLFLAWLL